MRVSAKRDVLIKFRVERFCFGKMSRGETRVSGVLFSLLDLHCIRPIGGSIFVFYICTAKSARSGNKKMA